MFIYKLWHCYKYITTIIITTTERENYVLSTLPPTRLTPDVGDFFPQHAVPQLWADTSGVSYNLTQIITSPGAKGSAPRDCPHIRHGSKAMGPQDPTLLSHLARRTQESSLLPGLPVYCEKDITQGQPDGRDV